MLRGCLLALLFYAALAVGYFFWLDTVFDRPQSYYGAAIVGLVVFFCIGALMGSWTALKDWSLLSAAGRGVAPRDGRPIAAAGKIYPVSQPLLAPFSHTECVICEYDLSRHTRRAGSSDEENTGSDFTGFLMVPSEIRSAQGNIRLLGFPLVEGYSESVCSDYASARRALDFLTTHEFENRTGVKMVSALGVFGDVWSDEDGLVERNIRLGTVSLPDLFPPKLEAAIDRQMELEALAASVGPQPLAGQAEASDEDLEDEDLEDEDDLTNQGENDDEDEALDDDEAHDDWDADDGEDHAISDAPPPVPRMTEKLIEVGADVCVIGFYNELRRGLSPPSRGRQPNRLFRGTAEEMIAASRSKFMSFLLGGLFFLGLAHAITYGAMQLYTNSPEVIRKRQQAAFEAVEKNDTSRLQGFMRRGMDINVRDSSGRTLLMVAKGPAVSAWLLEHGADVNATDQHGKTALMGAASEGRVDIMRQLLAAKADIDRRTTDYDRSALMMAVSQGKTEAAELLREAGAKDDVITADNGEELPVDGGEPLAVCREYLAAVHARDPATLKRLFSPRVNVDFNDTDWELWHNCRPIEIEKWTGFERGDDATITVQGVGGGGYPTIWTYQLRRKQGEWKITREEDQL